MVKAQIGIITALAKECWAMKALLESVTEVSVPGRGAGRRYYVGEIPARDGGKHTVALCLSGVGNNSAAIRASEMFQHFEDIDSVIMVGIAGGVPNPAKADEHVRLGDIVVSSEGGVTQYDFGKEIATTIDGETTVELHETSRPRPPDPILLEAVELLEVEEYDDNKRPWLEHIKRACDRFNVVRPPSGTDVLYSTGDPTKVIDHPDDSLRVPGQPRLFIGTIASGNVVLKNPVRRDYLRDEFRVKAVEMEGSGIADASWKKKVGYLVVRGICDYCDSHKNDAWQKYAAIAAAGYARALIESLPTSDQFTQDGPPNATVDEYLSAVKVFSESGTYITLPGPSSFAYVSLLLRRKNPKKSDELEIPLVLNGVLNDEPYVMFVGSGGAGKSTLLRRIARDAWDSQESLGLPRRYLPMVIRLSAFARTEEIVIEKLLKDALYKAGELSLPGDLPEGFFTDWAKEVGVPWFLLFDGLDEVAADERPSLIMQLSNLLDTIKANGHRAALTTRPGEFAVSLESKLTPYLVLSFTSQQQKEFAMKCFGGDAEIFLSQIKGLDADDLNGNPLLFTIAAVVFLHDRQLSNNKVSLYERFIQIWLEEATVRGLKNELGDDLYELVSSALEELAFQMTDRPDENSSIVLSRKLGIYLKDNLQVPLPKALEQGRRLVDVLGTRSGMFVKTGRICDWVHGNLREYLAGRAMDTQLLGSSDGYEKVLSERPFDSKWFEAVATLVQVNSKSTEILKWIAGRAANRADAESALLVHYYWTQTPNQNDPQTVAAVVDALMVGLADTQTGLNPPRRIKQALVEMGHPGVPALLAALSRLNRLQKELFPEWRGKQPPDVHTEPGKRVYQSSRQRQGIVEVFGQINDARTFDDLISLLDDDESDSNRIYLRHAAQKALACIGYPVIEPLLKIVGNSSHSIEKRHQALVALKLVGRRTDQVAQTLGACFREGLEGNHQLLNWSLFAATGLRDQDQSDFAAETLKLNNQELVADAADFFSAMPEDAPLKDLANSLERWNGMEAHPFSSSFGFRSLLSALVQTGERFAHQLVRRVVASSLRGEGQLRGYDALREAEKLPIAVLRRVVLTTSLAKLRQPPPSAAGNRLIAFLRRLWASLLNKILRKHRPRQQYRYDFRLSDAVDVLGNTWHVDQLTQLVKATRRIEAVAPAGVDDVISRYLHRPEAHSQSDFIDHGSLAHAFAKCQIRQFAERIGQFLEAADWDFERELSDLLWIAGDPKAEGALVRKLTKIRSEHSDSNDRIPELYNVMRALGMCGSAQGVDKIIETVLETPNVNIEFFREILWPLLMRRVLDPQRLITIADNSTTHEYARYFFVMGLGYFDAPAFSEFFTRMVADEDERVKANAAQFLGWSKEPGTIVVLTDLLQKTQSSFIAECAAGALRRLEASEASVEIIKAIERFGPTQTGGLLREAALLRSSSVVKYLKDITRKNEGTPWESDDLLHAVGEFYDQPWARTILEEWLENTGRRYDTGQQRLAFKVLAERDPNKLLAHAVRLYDENGLENSAQSRLIVLLRQLFRSQNVNSDLLVPMLKRLLCDEELGTRESVAEELIYLEPAQRLQIYEELTNMGNEWAQACGVYSLGFWDSDESEIERMRYAPVHIVRYFADRALTLRRKRPHLQQAADSFAKTEGVARVSSYLVLMQEGSEQFLHYLDEQIEDDRITEVFLPHMQSLVQSATKKRQDALMKEETDLFCKSARQVQFH